MKRFLTVIAALFLLTVASASWANQLRVCTITGAAAINSSCAVNDSIWIRQVTVHFSAAPTTSENLVFTVDTNAGAAYDTAVLTVDPSATSMTNLVWIPDDGALVMVYGDALDITYTNTDTRTIGIQVYYEFAR